MTEERIVFPFDPLERSAKAEAVVMKGLSRAYHRFRAAPYYGGITTADAVGCSFLCAYCWNYNRNLYPQRFQDLYSPQQVASKLLRIARKRNYYLFRITGAEPVLGETSFQHLVEVIGIILKSRPDGLFILETNGFFLGYRVDLLQQLPWTNLNVRVCLKGTGKDSFELITGAKKEFFHYPFQALQKLEEAGVRAWPALMRDLFTPNQIGQLRDTLDLYNIKADLELESLETYPFVLDNLKKRRVKIKDSLLNLS